MSNCSACARAGPANCGRILTCSPIHSSPASGRAEIAPLESHMHRGLLPATGGTHMRRLAAVAFALLTTLSPMALAAQEPTAAQQTAALQQLVSEQLRRIEVLEA